MACGLNDASLRVAASFGALNKTVARLLACQREEEPQTAVELIETQLSEQMSGLREGAFALGLSLTEAKHLSISSLPLHRDEIAVSVPLLSPLLAYERIPLSELANYPLIMWSDETCAPMNTQIKRMLESEGVSSIAFAEARTFGLMISLVAAGYGIGIGARSKTEAVCGQGIVVRPIAGPPRFLTTYLHHSQDISDPAVERFVERAKRVADTSQTADCGLRTDVCILPGQTNGVAQFRFLCRTICVSMFH